MPTKTAQLEAIIKRCQSGDEQAYGELFVLIRSDVHRIIIRTIGPDNEVDDVIQNSFLEILKSISKFKGKSKFSTWMYRVVVNVAFQHIRKRKTLMIPVDMNEMANDLPSNLIDPEHATLQTEKIRLAKTILAQMTAKKRIVFLLHEVEGYSPDEIAKIIGMSKFTVKSRLFYARKDFKKLLRKNSQAIAYREKAKTLSDKFSDTMD